MEAFLGEQWPDQGEYTICLANIVICSTQNLLSDPTTSILNTMYDDVSVEATANSCERLSYAETSYGARFQAKNPANSKRLTPENWEYLCGFSLLSERVEFTCNQASL